MYDFMNTTDWTSVMEAAGGCPPIRAVIEGVMSLSFVVAHEL